MPKKKIIMMRKREGLNSRRMYRRAMLNMISWVMRGNLFYTLVKYTCIYAYMYVCMYVCNF